MKAIQFEFSIPRYALGLALGKVLPKIYWSGLSCTVARETQPPALPTPAWVRVQTRYGGICGSDMGTIRLHTSPYYQPFSSFPFTFGHENVGVIAETGPEAGDWETGERVVVEPLLWCRPRGFEELCRYCARGEINLCERLTEGDLAPGLITGACRDTGGSWSRSFVAHPSQLYRLPDQVSDENGLMVEPFAVGLHAVLQNFPADDDTVLIQGAGTIGLCTLAALRSLGGRARVLVLARYPFQAQAAERLGANKVILTRNADAYQEIASRTRGRVWKPTVGKRVVTGGADLTFECVGSDAAIDDALRLTRAGGRVVLVGVPGLAKGIDWTTIFAQELTVRAANIYHHAEPFQGKTWRAFDLAIHLMASGKADLGWMITHKFTLDDYARALETVSNRGQSQAIKAVFTFEHVAG